MKKVADNVDTQATISFLFLPPMLYVSPRIVISESINVYKSDLSKPELDEHIFILFPYHPQYETNGSGYNVLSNHKDFIEYYSPSKDLIMYLYRVPEEYRTDYKLFKESKYSHISKGLKRQILKYHDLDSTSKTYKILYKTEDRRQQLENELKTYIDPKWEYWSVLYERPNMFNMPVENFDITILK